MIEPRGPINKRTRYLRVRFTARFHRQEGGTIETVSVGSVNSRPTDDLIQLQTAKHISTAAGTYSMTLVPRKDYLNELNPGDWCEIFGDNGDGVGLRPLLYGPISRVTRTRSVTGTGAVVERIFVRGADFGKALSGTSALQDKRLAREAVFGTLGLAAVANEVQAPTGKAGQIINAILDRYLQLEQWIDPKTRLTFGAGSSSGLGGASSALERRYISEETMGNIAIKAVALTESLWSVLQQWANLPVNEMFVDYRRPFENPEDPVNLSPALVLRQQPFFGDNWRNLRSIAIDRDAIIDDNLSKSDEDVCNWIRSVDSAEVATYAAGVGFFSPDSIRRHGFRRFENETEYFVNLDEESKDDLITLMSNYSAFQTVWHHSNDKLLKGTISTHFRPDARIGYRLDYSDTKTNELQEFYIEGVTHDLNYPGVSRTTLSVTRGRDARGGDPSFVGPTREADSNLFQRNIQQLVNTGVVIPIGSTLDRIDSALGVATEFGESE